MSRVLVLVPMLAWGGAERVAVVVANELASREDVVVLTYADSSSGDDRLGDGVRHIGVDIQGHPLLRLLRVARLVRRVARHERIDGIVSFLTHANIVAAMALATMPGSRRPKLLRTEHNTADALFRDGGRLRILALLARLSYRWPGPLACVSDGVADDLVERRVIARSRRRLVIPNPVPFDEVRRLATTEDAPRLPRRSSGEDVRMMCCARLHRQKGQRHLLDAMTLLPASTRLNIVGDGPDRAELEQQVARLGLGERVTFWGTLTNPYGVMGDADLVILPSEWEGFGLVALEAAALGRPFIGTDVPGLGDLCRLLGQRVVPSGDPDALARAIAAADPATADYDETTLQSFSPAAVADHYLRALGL